MACIIKGCTDGCSSISNWVSEKTPQQVKDFVETITNSRSYQVASSAARVVTIGLAAVATTYIVIYVARGIFSATGYEVRSKADVVALQTEIDKLKAENTDSQKKIGELETELEKANSGSLNKRIGELEDQLKTANAEHETTKKDLNGQLAGLREELEVVKKLLERTQDELQSSRAEGQKLKRTFDRAMGSVDKLAKGALPRVDSPEPQKGEKGDGSSPSDEG